MNFRLKKHVYMEAQVFAIMLLFLINLSLILQLNLLIIKKKAILIITYNLEDLYDKKRR